MYYNANKNINMIALLQAALSSTYTNLIWRHHSLSWKEHLKMEIILVTCFPIHTHSDALLPCGGFCPMLGMLLGLSSLSYTTTLFNTPAIPKQSMPERAYRAFSTFFYLIQLVAGSLLSSSYAERLWVLWRFVVYSPILPLLLFWLNY